MNNSKPDGRIHVMQASLGMNFGGMERVIIDLCRHVDPSKFRFSVCCLSLRGPLADEVEADGFPLIVCKNQTRVGKYFRGLELGRLLKEQRVDVLHTHNTTAFIDGVIGARLARVPVVVHTDHCKNYPIERRWMILENVASRLVDKVVAVSDHTRGELMHFEGIAAEKLTVIHNGITPRPTEGLSLAALRAQLGLHEGQPVIGTIGRLEPQKGLDMLLAAVPAVAALNPSVRFLIVGGGSQKAALESQAVALGIADRVIFAGWRQDAVDVLQLMDIFVQTSTFEGLPMVLLEAMAFAKPIVATAVGGVPEVVEPEFNGLLVNSRDEAELSRALNRLLADPDLIRRLGSNARDRYAQRYTAEAMASAYQRLYEEFLEQRKGRVA